MPPCGLLTKPHIIQIHFACCIHSDIRCFLYVFHGTCIIIMLLQYRVVIIDLKSTFQRAVFLPQFYRGEKLGCRQGNLLAQSCPASQGQRWKKSRDLLSPNLVLSLPGYTTAPSRSSLVNQQRSYPKFISAEDVI